MLTEAELMAACRFEYWGTLEAYPELGRTELEWLIDAGWTKEQIWQYAPDLAEDAGWKAPDWY